MTKQLPSVRFCKQLFFIILYLSFAFPLFAQVTQTFTSSGSFTIPAGVTSVTVETWGGGGAGGGAVNKFDAGGGGGGGAYNTGTQAITGGNTYGYIVGAGGAGSIGAGTAGGASSFNGSTVANGGGGGGIGASGTGGAGAAGGTFSGGNGAAGLINARSGAGGGGAGSGGAGGNATGITAGAAGATDGGTGGAGTNFLTVDGNPGGLIGGGGSGAITLIGANKIGGDGARGQVRITYTLPACTVPSTQPTSLILTAYPQIINGSFTASVPAANGYLVVRTATSTAPVPVNGTTYTAGANAIGYIESAGASNTFISTLLNAGTQYWYWVFGYNNTGCTGIAYQLISPLSGTVTTAACGSMTNTATVTTAGTATYNWSALAWSFGHLPTSCENAELILNDAGTSDVVSINLDMNISVYSYKMRNISPAPYVHIFQTNGSAVFTVANDMTMTAPGGNKFNRCSFANQNSTVINGNVILGRTTPSATEGHSAIGSTGNTPNQTYTLYGNMTFNPRGYTTDEWTKFIFDKAGTQYIYNNTTATDTIQPVLFENIVIGNTNAATVIFAGTTFDGYIENVRAAGVTIGVGSTLDLPGNYSLNKIAGGSAEPFNMLAGSRLKLGGDKSINVNGVITGVAGSNFPASFNTYNFDATSTVEYYGSNAITQTIYAGAAYANLAVTNGSGSGRAAKITTGVVTATASATINALADLNLGAAITSNGPFNVVSTGGLYCAANVVSGSNAFTLNNGSYLGMGHAQGISVLGSATGNIQMTTGRSFSASANYIYNGAVNQITGNGLPATCNDLTIANTAVNGKVTIATNQLVNGINLLQQGTFDIGTTNIIINGTGTLNSTGGFMKANTGIVEMKGNSGTAQNLAGSWFTGRNISSLINSNTKGITIAPTLNDTLLISSALFYGAGITNSAITTNDNLTLLSRDTGTAKFGEIVTGSGNTITGKVNIERYLYAKKSWRFLAAPVANATSPSVTAAWRESGVSTASTGYGTQVTGPYGAAAGMDNYTQRASMKYYSSVVNDYIDIANTITTGIANNKGYFVFVRGDRSVVVGGTTGSTILRIKGDLLTGDQTFPVTPLQFESMGNPYASRINFRTTVKNHIADAFTIWNPKSAGSYSVGGYETYFWNGTNYVKPGGAIRNYIESGEAVYIQNSSATPGSLLVKESDKGWGSAMQSFSSATVPTLEINMYTRDVDSTVYLADGFMMNFNNIYSAGVDNDDVRKFMNTYDNLAIINGIYKLIVERRPDIQLSDTFRLSLTGLRIAEYRLEMDPSLLNYPGIAAIFIDRFLGTETPVSFTGVTNVTFNITTDPASTAAGRFSMVFRPLATLPVKFTGISALRNTDKTVTVKWHTENEINMQNYSVERSTNGTDFIAIASQVPTTNTGGTATYTFEDIHAAAGINFYRVRGNSLTGQAQYTAIVKVSPLSAMKTMRIYPNPVTNHILNMRFENQAKGNYLLRVTNKAGQVMHTENITVQSGNMVRMITITGAAAPGSYQATISDADGNITTMPFIML